VRLARVSPFKYLAAASKANPVLAADTPIISQTGAELELARIRDFVGPSSDANSVEMNGRTYLATGELGGQFLADAVLEGHVGVVVHHDLVVPAEAEDLGRTAPTGEGEDVVPASPSSFTCSIPRKVTVVS
jgi:hypothetical protein